MESEKREKKDVKRKKLRVESGVEWSGEIERRMKIMRVESEKREKEEARRKEDMENERKEEERKRVESERKEEERRAIEREESEIQEEEKQGEGKTSKRRERKKEVWEELEEEWKEMRDAGLTLSESEEAIKSMIQFQYSTPEEMEYYIYWLQNPQEG